MKWLLYFFFMSILNSGFPVPAADNPGRPQDERALYADPSSWKKDHASTPYVLLPASAMEKFLPDELPADAEIRQKQVIDLDCARNEAESAQILIVPTGPAGLQKVTGEVVWETKPLPVEIFQVGRVHIEKPGAVSFQKPGRWPDPLFPHDRPFPVAAGEMESFWFTVRVPAEAEPGEYAARFVVRGDDVEQSVPIKIHVAKTTLPTTPRLQTYIYIYDGIPFYHEKWPEALAEVTKLLRKNRYCIGGPAMPATIDAENPDWTQFDQTMTDCLGSGNSIMMMPRMYDPAAPRQSLMRYRKLGDHLKQKGWLDNLFVWDFDEPSADRFHELGQYCRDLQSAAPGIRILLTQNYDPEFNDCNMIWCPANTWLDDETKMRAIQDRVRRGDGTFWTYNCENTRTTFHPDSWRIDWYGTGHRALGVMLWKYKATGYLYWCATYWCNYQLSQPHDMYANPSVIGYGNDGVPRNGDGFLIYPDPAGQRMPFPSIRLELNRDAFEDYELFALWKSMTGDDLPHEMQKLLPQSDNYNKAPQAYDTLHRKLLQAMDEVLSRGPDAKSTPPTQK